MYQDVYVLYIHVHDEEMQGRTYKLQSHEMIYITVVCNYKRQTR